MQHSVLKAAPAGAAALAALTVLLSQVNLRAQGKAAATPALNVPQDHPRIFFTKDDIAGFKQRMQSQPVAAGASERAAIRGHGFNYVVLGDQQSAERAIVAALAMRCSIATLIV